jgi:Calcineurin-like phosphoesterase
MTTSVQQVSQARQPTCAIGGLLSAVAVITAIVTILAVRDGALSHDSVLVVHAFSIVSSGASSSTGRSTMAGSSSSSSSSKTYRSTCTGMTAPKCSFDMVKGYRAEKQDRLCHRSVHSAGATCTTIRRFAVTTEEDEEGVGSQIHTGSDTDANGSIANGASGSNTINTLLGDYTYAVGILGDLHIDPRKMEDYEMGREHWRSVFQDAIQQVGSIDHVALVSLGDLGESKNCEHNPANPSELFAGTSLCHQIAAEYLGSFDGVPYEVIGGNHDLEGIDEFRTDTANLNAFLQYHNKPTPQFVREVADKTFLVGLCSTVFRDAKYTSHEVIIDQEQIQWFEHFLTTHPAEEGNKIFVFTHAPPNGSGLRVLQENHVINGCCWLNHSDERNCRIFIELVRKHRCIKAWFSGHFHLGQDYQDSITFPTIDPKDGPYPNRGSCVFAQTSVIRSGASRDGRQQSRLIRGNDAGFEICTVDHAKDGKIRLDATIAYRDDSHNVGVYAHDDEAYAHDKYFKVYTPQFDDAGFICGVDELDQCLITDDCPVEPTTVSWWKLASGHVLGLLNGMLLEYDPSTLAPLGLVVSADELVGKNIAVIDSGIEECEINFDSVGMEGADCGSTDSKEQAVIIYDDQNNITVIQPNEDGSYWRKIVRNKIARMKEKRREKAAIAFAKQMLDVEDAAASKLVRSSWGPYTSTSGVAKTTTVQGLTRV